MKKEIEFGINFHLTFPPEPLYVARILGVADGTPRSIREISDLTGIPQGESSGKVKPHLCYAAYMGLIEPDIAVPKRTALGDMIYNEDSACREPITQYLMHTRLTSAEGAIMWHRLVRDLLYNNGGSIPCEFMANRMAAEFKCNPKRIGCLHTTYTEQLTAIDFLAIDDSVIHVNFRRPEREYLYLYGYDLLREWEAVYPGESELTLDTVNALGCAICFGLHDESWFEVLERLNDARVIRLNKQLVPCTVVALTTAEKILTRIYSLLL